MRNIQSGRDQMGMKAGLVESGLSDVRGIDQLGFSFRRQSHEAGVGILRTMMLAVHVQEHSSPDIPSLKELVKRFDPDGLDEKKVQSEPSTVKLNPMDEEIIRIEFVRHYEIVNARHARIIKV